MPNKRSSEPIAAHSLDVHEHEAATLTLTYDELFSVVWIEHYGPAKINFESHELQGHYLIFLCPEEVLSVSGYVQAKSIAFPSIPEVVASPSFIHAYGAFEKGHALQGRSYKAVDVLFDQLKPLAGAKATLSRFSSRLNELITLVVLPETPVKDQELLFAYRFTLLLHEHYKMKHDMAFYAKKLATTPKRIAERFYQLGLPPPHQFIKNRIVLEAKRQLVYSSKMAKLICFDIGFNDPAYFARFFKKNTGMTCRQFRQLNKPI